jgi:hypothetical protein
MKYDPIIGKCRREVLKALKDGRLKKGPCARCGSIKRIEGHHPDHRKPLEIIWLCHTCHSRLHLVESGAFSRNGKIQGDRNRDSGFLEKIRRKGKRLGAFSLGGKRGGATNVKSGLAFKLPHLRWHVNRGIINPSCKFCMEEN